MEQRKTKRQRFGDLPPQYYFILNPYPDVRCNRCPNCGAKTGQRKLPLLIHINPNTMIAFNYTNRYCKHCDWLIAHQFEIEHFLTEHFRDSNPELVGNDYLIIGTVNKKAWRENMQQPKPPAEMFKHASDFKAKRELRMSLAGYYPEGVEPPERKPPPSTEWVKQRQ